jgi:hypothetical protein
MKLEQIEDYLNSVKLPEYITVKQGEKIVDVRGFVDSHIATLKANSGNRTFLPYYNRLLALVRISERKLATHAKRWDGL